MNTYARLVRHIPVGLGLLAMLCFLAPLAYSDCAKDINGEIYCGGGQCLRDRSNTIWCSRNYEGNAVRTRDGRVLCGKGQCAKDSRGQIFCSSETGGTVLIDSKGSVRCYGRCERATAEQCENTPADISD